MRLGHRIAKFAHPAIGLLVVLLWLFAPPTARSQYVMQITEGPIESFDNGIFGFDGKTNGKWDVYQRASASIPLEGIYPFIVFLNPPELGAFLVSASHSFVEPMKSEPEESGVLSDIYRDFFELLDGLTQPNDSDVCFAVRPGPRFRGRPNHCTVKVDHTWTGLRAGGYRVTGAFEAKLSLLFVPQPIKDLTIDWNSLLPRDSVLTFTPEARLPCRLGQVYNRAKRVCECPHPQVFNRHLDRCETRVAGGGEPPPPPPPPPPPRCVTDECRCQQGIGGFDLCWECIGREPRNLTHCFVVGFRVDGIPIVECVQVDDGYATECSERYPRIGSPWGWKRRMCTDGERWAVCTDDAGNQLPFVNEEEVPLHHVEWLFPPCHRAVSGTLITPCEGSPLDPDLVITELSHSPASPEAGESVDATLRVRNLGPAVAPNTRFRLRFSGGGVTRESVLWVGSLASGAERSFVVRSLDSGFGVALGSNRIEVTVDSHDELLEGREDNNYKEISFIGVSASTSGIDFRIRDLDFSPQHPVERERVTVTFDTVNSGSLAASETKVRLAVLDPTGNYVVNELVPVDALEAMTSREEEFSFVGWAPGLYSLVVTMDPTEEVAESREENNSFFVTVDFAEEALCLPCTSGAPNNEVGATLCLEHSNPVFPPSAGAQWICRGVRADGSTCVPSGNHPNGWGFHQPRCPDSASLPPGWHPDVCGNVGICPGLGTAP